MTLYEKIIKKFSGNFKTKTIDHVKEFFAILGKEIAWHPDTPFEDYINTETGLPTFTPEEAGNLNWLMQNAFDICNDAGVDIYGLACDTYNSSNATITHYLFGIDAVKVLYEDDFDELCRLIEEEDMRSFELYIHDSEKDPSGCNLLNAFNGYMDFAILTPEEYNTLNNL